VLTIDRLYPFVPEKDFAQAAKLFKEALEYFKPFTITVNKLGHFEFGRRSTLFLEIEQVRIIH
jgi:hypothetical protein